MFHSVLNVFQPSTGYLVFSVSKLKGIWAALMTQVEGWFFLDQNKATELH